MDVEALHHRITHRRSLLADDLAEAELLVALGGVLKDGRDETGADEPTTQLGQRHILQPAPRTQGHLGQSAAEHDGE